MSTKTRFATLVGLAALGFAAGADAGPAMSPTSDRDAVSVKVSFADLDASGEAGAKALLKRIQNAARDICGSELNPFACRSDTVDRAVASLGNPAVTALKAGHDRSPTVLAARGR